jgi:hypothetical protein
MPDEYYKQLDRSGEKLVKALAGLVQIAKMLGLQFPIKSID